MLLNFLCSGLSCCLFGRIFEKDPIQPDGDDVNNDQNWNQNKPLILKLIGKLLNPKDR